jgi:hypothetical protein
MELSLVVLRGKDLRPTRRFHEGVSRDEHDGEPWKEMLGIPLLAELIVRAEYADG